MAHSEDHSTERPGDKLKRARARLKLTYRDVELASQQIATRRDNQAFAIALSRLADIENQGTVPTIYRLYSLAAIYHLDLDEILRWYGISRQWLPADSLQIQHAQTHPVHVGTGSAASGSGKSESRADGRETTFLGSLNRPADVLPVQLLNSFDGRKHRYAMIGVDDWAMYPILHPGSLILIDDRRRKITLSGWTNEYDRPIYFLEHRDGYYCGWCNVEQDRLILQTHPASRQQPKVFDLSEIDVIGQVIGVTMTLATGNRRSARSATTPELSPDQ